MSLNEQELERLADVVRLQPTKNKDLQERWAFDSGSEVHRYLEDHLKEYYYRDDDSYICATTEAAELVGLEPGGEEGTETVRVSEREAEILEVLAGPDERSESVVSVLQKLREAHDVDPEAGDVRRALRSLNRKGVVDIVYRTVPTFKLAADRDDLPYEVV